MKITISLFCLICLPYILLNAQTVEKFDAAGYSISIDSNRRQKDLEMKTDAHSPIPENEKESFLHLNYYKPEIEYRKVAKFTRFDQAAHFFMKTTTDRLPEYSLYGKVTFQHKGKDYSLNVYQNIELVKKPGYEKHLFVPFNDETNGEETYGGGRFLDVYETGADSLVIDFNLAYNPYCAYNHKYSCPIPPESNMLDTKIEAGEKKWHN
jgi:uncharacterized protein